MRKVSVVLAPQFVAFTLVLGAIEVAERGWIPGPWGSADEGLAVEWGGVMHSTPEELAAWLAERGGTYEVWVQGHPRAAVRLERAAAQAEARGGDSIVPLGTSTLALFTLVFASATLLAALARRPRGARRAGGKPLATTPLARTASEAAVDPPATVPPARPASRPRWRLPARRGTVGRKTPYAGGTLALPHHRVDSAFLGAGVALSVLAALLVARLL